MRDVTVLPVVPASICKALYHTQVIKSYFFNHVAIYCMIFFKHSINEIVKCTSEIDRSSLLYKDCYPNLHLANYLLSDTRTLKSAFKNGSL